MLHDCDHIPRPEPHSNYLTRRQRGIGLQGSTGMGLQDLVIVCGSVALGFKVFGVFKFCSDTIAMISPEPYRQATRCKALPVLFPESFPRESSALIA